MDRFAKHRMWVMAGAAGVVLLGILVWGMGFASAQTATPMATGTAAAMGTPTGMATTTTGTASPTSAATTVAGRTAITTSLQISLPQQSFITMKLALQAAQAALTKCSSLGYPVAVTVVDQAGLQKVLLKGDGAGPQTVSGSFKKAFASAALGSPTTALATLVQQNPALADLSRLDDRIVLIGGGLPIIVNNQVVGGIGVSGTPSGQTDESCAQGGLDSLR